MDFSITITLFVQIANSILGLYIVAKIYIGPVVKELMEEDLLAEKLEALLAEKNAAIEKEKEQYRLYALDQHKKLKKESQEAISFEKEVMIELESFEQETPDLEEASTLLAAALIKEVKNP